MNKAYLLDTHVLLWAVAQPHRLSARTRTLVKNNEYAVSAASLWELINKKEKRSAPVQDPVPWWTHYVVRQQTPVIPIRMQHVAYLDQLPWVHRDPYDRILMAQSLVEKMVLVTNDTEIRKYNIDLLIAGPLAV